MKLEVSTLPWWAHFTTGWNQLFPVALQHHLSPSCAVGHEKLLISLPVCRLPLPFTRMWMPCLLSHWRVPAAFLLRYFYVVCSRFPTHHVCCSVICRGKLGLTLFFFFFRDIHSISHFLYTYYTLHKMAHFHILEGFPVIFFSLILKMNGDTCFYFPRYWQHYLRFSVMAVLYALVAYVFINLKSLFKNTSLCV